MRYFTMKFWEIKQGTSHVGSHDTWAIITYIPGYDRVHRRVGSRFNECATAGEKHESKFICIFIYIYIYIYIHTYIHAHNAIISVMQCQARINGIAKTYIFMCNSYNSRAFNSWKWILSQLTFAKRAVQPSLQALFSVTYVTHICTYICIHTYNSSVKHPLQSPHVWQVLFLSYEQVTAGKTPP